MFAATALNDAVWIENVRLQGQSLLYIAFDIIGAPLPLTRCGF
jgi:hypothetical protein